MKYVVSETITENLPNCNNQCSFKNYKESVGNEESGYYEVSICKVCGALKTTVTKITDTHVHKWNVPELKKS